MKNFNFILVLLAASLAACATSTDAADAGVGTDTGVLLDEGVTTDAATESDAATETDAATEADSGPVGDCTVGAAQDVLEPCCFALGETACATGFVCTWTSSEEAAVCTYAPSNELTLWRRRSSQPGPGLAVDHVPGMVPMTEDPELSIIESAENQYDVLYVSDTLVPRGVDLISLPESASGDEERTITVRLLLDGTVVLSREFALPLD